MKTLIQSTIVALASINLLMTGCGSQIGQGKIASFAQLELFEAKGRVEVVQSQSEVKEGDVTLPPLGHTSYHNQSDDEIEFYDSERTTL